MTPAIDYSLIADVYDDLVRFAADIPFFLEECRQARGRVLELMSGTGRVSLPLIEAGVDLTCVDSSPEMLCLLKDKLVQRGLTADALQQDVRRLHLAGPFALAFIPFHSFHELVSPEDRRATLESICGLLAADGRFVCTLHNPPMKLSSLARGPQTVGQAEIEGGELALVLDVEYESSQGIVSGTETLVRRDDQGRERSRTTIPIRYALIEEPSFRQLVQEAGFLVQGLYGDYDRTPFASRSSPFMIWVLGK